MLRTLVWFIYFWMYLILLLPLLFYYWRLDLRHDARLDGKVDRKVRNWARRLMWVAGMKVTVNGAENLPERQAVFIANHQGNFDIPLMLSCLGRAHGLLAKQELARIPILRLWMRLLHCLFVDRSSPRAGMESIAKGVKLLQSGHSLIIFPEGTRSRSGELQEFKGGAFRIASKASAAIVPVTIDGSYRAMEANPTGWLIRPCEVTVTIHPAIETAGLGREELRELPSRTRDVIASALLR
ncbi:1-acyl-sn-glycerol-3-phosphate acyltransferase [Butyricicoccus sp. 1XD8-22]|nr:1-acyl-sn-glycerol-3-phosphate acyltransferase [Butyricicoccus sp. 1XD8-22]